MGDSRLSCIHEYNYEDINGIYVSSSNTDGIVLCLDELVIPPSEVVPQNEATPEADVDICQHVPESSPDMWLKLEVSEYYAQKEAIM